MRNNSKNLSIATAPPSSSGQLSDPLLVKPGTSAIPLSPLSPTGSSPGSRRKNRGAKIWGVFTNTLKSVFGTGVLAMPFAFAKVGIYPGLLATTVICCWSFYTCSLIAQCCSVVPGARTYDDIAEQTLGRFGKTLGTVNIFLNQMLCCVAYNVFCATNITDVAGFETGDMGYPRWLVLAMLPCIAAFACLRDISLLSVVSAFGNSFLLASLATILVAAAPNITWTVWAIPPEWNLSSLASFFGLTAFAFAGHSEVVPIFSSMGPKEKYPVVLLGVAATSLVCFGGLGAAVFSAYGDNTKPIVFQNMDSVTADVAKLAMSVVIYLTMPLKLFAAIMIVESRLIENLDGDDTDGCVESSPGSDSMIPEELTAAERVTPVKVQVVDTSADTPAHQNSFHMPNGTTTGEDVDDGEDDSWEWPFVSEPKQILIRVILATIPTCIASLGVNFAVLLEFVGSFCIGTVAFALPPIMHLKLFWDVEVVGDTPVKNKFRKAFHVFLAIIGVSATIYSSASVIVNFLNST